MVDKRTPEQIEARFQRNLRYRVKHKERLARSKAAYNRASRPAKASYDQRRYRERADWINAFKLSKGCTDCGCRPTEPSVLELDHVHGVKGFTIGGNLTGYSHARLQEEVAKCEVVCANCHRVRTAGRRIDTRPSTV
jgi:hypothetical protein